MTRSSKHSALVQSGTPTGFPFCHLLGLQKFPSAFALGFLSLSALVLDRLCKLCVLQLSLGSNPICGPSFSMLDFSPRLNASLPLFSQTTAPPKLPSKILTGVRTNRGPISFMLILSSAFLLSFMAFRAISSGASSAAALAFDRSSGASCTIW